MSERGVLWAVWLLCTWAPVRAALPEVAAWLDTNRTTLGAPVHLALKLRYAAAQRPELPPADQLLAGFSARRVGEPKVETEGDIREQILLYQLKAYELGQQQIPPLSITFVRASGDTLVRTAPALDFEVVSVRREGETELRDISPPVEIAGGIPLWLAAVLGVLLLLGIVVAVLWLLERRKKPEVVEVAAPVDYAAEFVHIANMGLLERGEYKTYYSLLSDNLRRYLEEDLGVEAMEQTTAELRFALRQVEMGKTIAAEVEHFLDAADLVKFARFIPDLAQARGAPEAGMAIVRRVEAIRAAEARRARESQAARASA